MAEQEFRAAQAAGGCFQQIHCLQICNWVDPEDPRGILRQGSNTRRHTLSCLVREFSQDARTAARAHDDAAPVGGRDGAAQDATRESGINNGLTRTNVRALAINPAGHVFAGTFGGAFRSTDNGDTWVAVNNGLDFPFVISLAINPSGDVFAGAFGQAWEKIRFSLEPQAAEMAFTVPLTMATVGRFLTQV
jgi:hypothetical protein